MAKMIFARPDGQWFDFPPLELAGMSGGRIQHVLKPDLIPLPEGATLTMMPLAAPIGFDAAAGEFLALAENPYKKKSEPVYAVAALLPQGFTRLLLPAAEPAEKTLPILGYTAVGVEKGRLVVAAAATDEHRRWNPKHFNTPALEGLVQKRLQAQPENRILRQLAKCSLEYGCFTAQNIFYRRWEGGVPASPACNAACLACLSEQQQGGADSPQQRIDFCPQCREIVEIAVPHLQHAEDAMISFGQGCEGEPTLAAELICEALTAIRRETSRGLLNINTNAGRSAAVRELIAHGIDSLRVSMFSAVEADYQAYHQPKDYAFRDVCDSLAAAAAAGVPVAINLLAYPGFSDDETQLQALIELARRYDVRQIQLRNLNCDPALMAPFCRQRQPLGMRRLLQELQRQLPQASIGNYSRDLRQQR